MSSGIKLESNVFPICNRSTGVPTLVGVPYVSDCAMILVINVTLEYPMVLALHLVMLR